MENIFQIGTILSMLGHQLDDEVSLTKVCIVRVANSNCPTFQMLQDIINEVDADGSGELEFEEFVQLAARLVVS